MKVNCVWEHNGNDSLVFAENYVGAFTRGSTLEVALQKMEAEIISYAKWRGLKIDLPVKLVIVMEKTSSLNIGDADSDVIFDTEKQYLASAEYEELKRLALKSASDFLSLYNAIPNKSQTTITPRKTFYGDIPRTAQQMYEHTKNVNAYYFSEIGVDADNVGDIFLCRAKGFALLEKQPNFLTGVPRAGSYDEQWSLRKVFRRFLWHDRIHAKAMYRMAKNTFPLYDMPDPFCFGDLYPKM